MFIVNISWLSVFAEREVKAIITDKREPGSSATHAFLSRWQVLSVCATVIAGECSTGWELLENKSMMYYVSIRVYNS